jgi:hypothetical protein
MVIEILQYNTSFPAPVTPISHTPFQLPVAGPTYYFPSPSFLHSSSPSEPTNRAHLVHSAERRPLFPSPPPSPRHLQRASCRRDRSPPSSPALPPSRVSSPAGGAAADPRRPARRGGPRPLAHLEQGSRQQGRGAEARRVRGGHASPARRDGQIQRRLQRSSTPARGSGGAWRACRAGTATSPARLRFGRSASGLLSDVPAHLKSMSGVGDDEVEPGLHGGRSGEPSIHGGRSRAGPRALRRLRGVPSVPVELAHEIRALAAGLAAASDGDDVAEDDTSTELGWRRSPRCGRMWRTCSRRRSLSLSLFAVTAAVEH